MTEEILSQFEVYSTTNSSSSEVMITNSVKIAFFDWDNTLFCTDYLAKFNINYKDIFSFQGNLNEINADFNYQLILLQESILKLFSKLIEDHFTIFIISNADLKWIQNCLEHFLCELKDFIEINSIQIYSAKNLFSTNTSSCKWKIKCFRKVLIENCEFIFGKNIIVLCIGDSKEEQKAAIELRKVKFFGGAPVIQVYDFDETALQMDKLKVMVFSKYVMLKEKNLIQETVLLLLIMMII